MTEKKDRLIDIDVAKGLAIFLVVLGHLVSKGEPPRDAEWYMNLQMLIYKFHMPFFMFLSGLIYYYTYRQIKSFLDYKDYVLKKIRRFIPAYLFFAFVILFGKIIASNYIHVDNVNYELLPAIKDIFIFPSRSVAGSIWYIYVLLELYLIVPILLTIFRNNLMVLIIAGLVIHFVPVTKLFMLDSLFEYFIYFILGAYAVSRYEEYKSFIDKYNILFICLFAASFFSLVYVNDEVSKFIIGIFSLPALYGLVRLNICMNSRILHVLGAYTFSIYLMNTIAIGSTKGIMFEFMSWDGVNFIVYAPILLTAGIVFPIIIKKYIFVRIPYLNRITN